MTSANSSASDNSAESAVAVLMTRVGERVRRARQSKNLPRRVLSDMSGVSPRYLAQLEAGEGNISIGLLLRVSIALDHPIEWFLAEDDPNTSDVFRVVELFRSASEDTRASVLKTLAPEPTQSARAQRICLIGLRGAGKSTLGSLLGDALNTPFVELNDDIESQSGMPVDEVMALYGPEGYRNLEAQALERVISQHDNVILAVAGGIVAESDTFTNLLTHFHSVWIKTSPDEHMSRVRAQGDERPMAGNPEAMDQLKTILTSREAHYGKANAVLDTSGKTVEQSLTELLQTIQDHGFLA